MAKRLTEDDIRRIFREEAEREKTRDNRLHEAPPEVETVFERLRRSDNVPLRKGGYARSDTPAGDVDWKVFIAEVIDTYWEVVEEDLNEPDKA